MRNDKRLDKSQPVIAKSTSSRFGRRSVMTREDAGVDCDEPWIASCDEHGQMVGCSTKASAKAALRSMDFCSECQKGMQ